MPIPAIRAIERSRIGWMRGTPPPNVVDLFAARGYEVVALPSGSTNADYAGMRAVIIEQDLTMSSALFVGAIRETAKPLLDEGCTFVIRPLHEKDRAAAVATLSAERIPTARLSVDERMRFKDQPEGDPPFPHARVSPRSEPWCDVANVIAHHEHPGAANAALSIQAREDFAPDIVRLLQRAFSDCRIVQLWRMEEAGRSGAAVYEGYAELAADLGPWPQPYFVKIGKRESIHREFVNYQQTVHPYIPFHLAPHLVSERCCLGAVNGVIVGSFVDESEGLLECAENGRADSALTGLFERTMRGWRRASREERVALGQVLGRRMPKTIPESRLVEANQLGATMALEDIAAIIRALPEQQVRIGPIHGDLHAQNIRVRKSEAILIDFFAHEKAAPVLIDAASLEASLLVEGFRKHPRVDDTQQWFESLVPLYDKDPMAIGGPVCRPDNPSHWFHSSVGIVRRYARTEQVRGMQYAAALVVSLLRKSSKDPGANYRESTRRAAAYLIAERLARMISGSMDAGQ